MKAHVVSKQFIHATRRGSSWSNSKIVDCARKTEIGELGQSQQELVILQNRFHTTDRDNDKILECYELMQKIREKESLISSLKLSIEQRQTELVRLHVQPEQEAVEAAFPRDFREMMYMRDV